MKLLKISLTAALFLLAASSLFAQTNLPDPNDSACWKNLDALHQCAQVKQDRALSQAERCTSYPEYQCQAESEQSQPVRHVARIQKQKAKDAKANGLSSPRTRGNDAGSDAVVLDLSSEN